MLGTQTKTVTKKQDGVVQILTMETPAWWKRGIKRPFHPVMWIWHLLLHWHWTLALGANHAQLSNMNVIPQKTPHPRDTNTQTHFLKKRYLVVESTHMQGGVSRCILGAHFSSVEQQVFQVLHVAIAAGLEGHIYIFTIFTNIFLQSHNDYVYMQTIVWFLHLFWKRQYSN